MLEIRPAEWQDCEIIWKWRNNPITRKYSFNTKFILFKEHRAWFKNALKDRRRKILLIEADKTPAGVVRFDIDSGNRTAEININIALEHRGKGLGTRAIKESCNYGFSHLNIIKVIARVKKENTSSEKVFSKAGFRTVQENEITIMELEKWLRSP